MMFWLKPIVFLLKPLAEANGNEKIYTSNPYYKVIFNLFFR